MNARNEVVVPKTVFAKIGLEQFVPGHLFHKDVLLKLWRLQNYTEWYFRSNVFQEYIFNLCMQFGIYSNT